MEEESEEEVEGLRKYSEVHKMNLDAASVEEMLLWVRSVRVFKKRSCKSEYQHM